MHPIRILIADDEPDFLDIIRKSLEIYGYETAGALNGAQALELCRSFLPHAIFLDVMMPGMSGIETLRQIREFDKEVPIVMISGMHDLQAAREAIKLGARDYLTKPFEIRTLDSYINKLVEERTI